MRALTGTFLWLMSSALVLGCDASGPEQPRSSPLVKAPAMSTVSTPPLVEHVIAPQATDPLIDRALDDHYAWIDTTAATNRQLFVYLPGSGGVPANALLLQQEAARIGYHSIGLSYVSDYYLAGLCSGNPDVDSCFESTHYEIVYGIDQSPLVDVSVPNSIVSRLTKLLQYLAARYPDEGWSQFLVNGNPRWSQIALGGISQGSGNSAMIAKYNVVPRVVQFSGVTDALGSVDCAPTQSWLSTHVTPSDRYWGLAHVQDPAFGNICGNWSTLGMGAFGPTQIVEVSAPPYSGTHMLVTDLKPQRESYKAAHASTVIDLYTPLNKDGTPALADAWAYLLSAPTKDKD